MARGATPKNSASSQATGARQAAIVGRLAVVGPAARGMSGGVHVRSFRGVRSEEEHSRSNTFKAMCSAGRSNNACVSHNSCVARPALPAVLFTAPRGPCPADFTGICRHIGWRSGVHDHGGWSSTRCIGWRSFLSAQAASSSMSTAILSVFCCLAQRVHSSGPPIWPSGRRAGSARITTAPWGEGRRKVACKSLIIAFQESPVSLSPSLPSPV